MHACRMLHCVILFVKERMERLQRETSELEAQHKDQMREAMDNLEVIKEAHKKDVVHIQAVTSKES